MTCFYVFCVTAMRLEIGIGLTGFGCVFLLLGVILLFDRVLLALGNLVLLAGLILLIGPTKTVRFFTSRAKIRGSICFLVGIVLCLVGWPVIGMIVEIFGIMNLFGYAHKLHQRLATRNYVRLSAKSHSFLVYCFIFP